MDNKAAYLDWNNQPDEVLTHPLPFALKSFQTEK